VVVVVVAVVVVLVMMVVVEVVVVVVVEGVVVEVVVEVGDSVQDIEVLVLNGVSAILSQIIPLQYIAYKSLSLLPAMPTPGGLQ
jgi:hypothetical protein